MKVTIGTRFCWSHADANPVWEVLKARGHGTWDCVIVDCPDYAGTKAVFSSEQILGAVAWEESIKKSQDDSNSFFERQVPGTVLHYHNGFSSYVRCLVTEDKKLLPVSLVGEWQKFDLPKRHVDGSIYYGYNAEGIMKKRVFRPHASNVYEYSPKGLNPISFPPVSLDVPEMTEEQNRIAELWKRVAQVSNIIRNHGGSDPEKILKAIAEVL